MTLLERADSQEQLLGWAKDAAAGQGRLVLLAGEAGVGKTVFLRAFAQRHARGANVLTGGCEPLSTPRPLGPLHDMAGRLGREFEQLLDADRRARIFRTFLTFLNDRPGGASVIIEDAHWADDATLDLLRFLGRRVEGTRTLLIVSYRDDEVGPNHPLRAVIGDLVTCTSTRRLKLLPLSEPAVGELAREHHLDPAALYARTAGNPFYVTEVIESGTDGVPETVRDAVLARAARLSPRARAALDVMAVAGARVEPWLLDDLLGPQVDAVEEGLNLGVLQARPDGLTFRHELARQTILATLTPPRRRALHRQVLDVLTRASGRRVDPARLADHAEAAGDVGLTLTYAVLAAREATKVRAHREACAQLARALVHADHLSPVEQAELLGAYAEECFITDRVSEAIRARSKALGLWEASGHLDRVGETHAHLARLLVGMGRNDEAERESQTALAMLETCPAGSALAFAYWCQAHLRMLNRDNQDAVRWGEQAVTLAEQHQDRSILVLALNTVGTARLLEQDERGRALLERSRDVASAAGLDDHVALAYRMLGSVAGELYQFERADRSLQEGLRYCAEHDLDGHGSYMRAWQALSHLYQGRWKEAADTSLSVLARSETAATSRIMALVALGRLRTRRGDPQAWDALDEALVMADRTGTLQRLAPVRAARAEAAWLSGDLDRVEAEARTVYDLACAHRHPWFAGELAYWRWKATGDTTAPAFAARPFALELSGAWQEAADVWEALRCPYEAARARLSSGDEEALRQALRTFEGLGAGPARAMNVRALRDLGVRSVPRGPRAATRANPANLTARELQVLRLVQRGLHDAEIARNLGLSVKTAGHHVSSLLAKLGVRNRTEAGREAVRLGLDGNGEAERER
ncbi:ATP-binding protein [Deinococcus pimensis]|uniref:ATP-binding protein n=1 Tax=Deinococcus pimensis TaxID=309888 RepID=UPI0004BAB343|nr:AAA family ATPase [Deinococcus pimensis]